MQVNQPFFPSQNYEVLKNTVEASNTVSYQVIIWETANEIVSGQSNYHFHKPQSLIHNKGLS